jgi:hypothetical protein
MRNVEVQLDRNKMEDASRDRSNGNDQEDSPEPGALDLSEWRAQGGVRSFCGLREAGTRVQKFRLPLPRTANTIMILIWWCACVVNLHFWHSFLYCQALFNDTFQQCVPCILWTFCVRVWDSFESSSLLTRIRIHNRSAKSYTSSGSSTPCMSVVPTRTNI